MQTPEARIVDVDINSMYPNSPPAFVNAVIEKKIMRVWGINVIHCADGPAITFENGDVEWWFLGERLTFNEFAIRADWSDEQIIMWKLSI